MISYQVEAFGKPLAQALRDTPTPQGTEVLLRIESSGVCHSDVHLQDGYFELGGGNKLDLSRTMALPRTLGHEIAGRVVALGPDAQGVAIGDQRVAFPWIGCGACSVCAAGNEHLCAAPRGLGTQRDGGFSDHVLVPHARYLFDYGSLPQEQACTLACAGITAYSALKKVAPLASRDALLIIGAGGVGLSGIRIAREVTGVAPIVAEIDRDKWDLAREAGAAEVIDPSEPDTAKALMKRTGGGVAAAIDFVGAASSFQFGQGALRKGGTLVCVGLFGGGVQVMPALMALRAISITGSYVGSLQEMQEVLALAQAGSLPPLPLVTRQLADASLVLDALRAGRVRGRAVLKP